VKRLQNQEKKKPAGSWLKKLSIILISLFLLYVIAGFFVLPRLLKPRLENELANQLGRKVTIEEIRINPLALSAAIRKLTVYEKDGEPFSGFEELFVNAQLFSSIIEWAAKLKEIRLLAPFGVLKLLPDNNKNIDDIVAKFSQPRQAPPPDQKSELPRVVISTFQVKDGKFSLEDLTGKEPIAQTFTPITFTLENLSTLEERQGAFKFVFAGPSGGQYQLDGQLSVNPVRIQGSYSTLHTDLSHFWQHIKERVNFQIVKGAIGASGNYLLELRGDTLNAKLQNGRFELKDFQLTEKGQDKVLISIPSFGVHGISADLKTREIMVQEVKTADAAFVSWLEPDGTFKLRSLLLPDSQKSPEKNKPSDNEPETTAGRPWLASINKIEVANWSAAIEDRTLPKPAKFSFDNITFRIDDLSTKKNAKAKVDIALMINQAGKVKVNGSAGIDPLMADLKVVSDKIELKSFQPYDDTAVNAQIEAGTISSEGRVVYQGKEGQPQIRYEGEMSLDGLEMSDRVQTKEFIKLAQFKTSGTVLELLPNKLQVAEVLIDKPYINVTIDPNGTVNVADAFAPAEKGKGDQKGSQNLLQRLADFLTTQIKGPMPMGIELVQLNNFSADFVDGTIKPAYSAQLEITKGTVKGLSSDPSARGDFKIEGTIDQSAAIESAGQMNPMNALHYAKIDFSLKDFDLVAVTPYSGKYAGHKIAEGKLHLELAYLVDNQTIDAGNKIYIDQLTLGDKVDSPDAPNLPLELGIALLKDANGRITLNVPVRGNVKDPKFSIGQSVNDALTKTIDDAGKSPFATIAEIDGFKGQELRIIEFESGLSELNAQAKKKLDALAKFLNKKTELTLGVAGTADRQVDGTPASGKQTEKAESGDAPKADSSSQQDQAQGQVVDDEQLKMLAQKRAEQVKAYLTQSAKVAEKRVQLKPAQIKSAAGGGYGHVELFLAVQQ
jgi:outer membrane protein OmpA-like peptidoglycan-associated protein